MSWAAGVHLLAAKKGAELSPQRFSSLTFWKATLGIGKPSVHTGGIAGFYV